MVPVCAVLCVVIRRFQRRSCDVRVWMYASVRVCVCVLYTEFGMHSTEYTLEQYNSFELSLFGSLNAVAFPKGI